MEAVAQKYRDRIEFLFIYAREAHPDIVPFLVETSERGWTRADVALAMHDSMKMKRRVLLDAPGRRSLQRHFGDHDDGVMVIGTDGRLALLQPWSAARVLDDFLGKFLAGGGRFQESLARATEQPTIDIAGAMQRFVKLGRKKAYSASGPIQ